MHLTLTPSMRIILHTAESVFWAALLSVIVGLVQQISVGQTSAQMLLTVFGAGFLGALSMAYKSVRTSPALPQAKADALAEGITEAQQVAQETRALLESWLPFLHGLNASIQQQRATPAPKAPTPITFMQPVAGTTAVQAPTFQSTIHYGDTGTVPSVTP